jgi:hypothetical protein
MTLRRTLLILLTFLYFLSLGGCRSHSSRGPHIQDGSDWLSWSTERRETFVKDFLNGYLYGTLDTCARAGTLFRSEGEQLPPAEMTAAIDVAARCQSHLNGFSKFRTSADRPADVSPYTVPLTAFYKNHPTKRYLPIDAELLGLRDSTYDEAVGLYEEAGDKGLK